MRLLLNAGMDAFTWTDSLTSECLPITSRFVSPLIKLLANCNWSAMINDYFVLYCHIATGIRGVFAL